MSLTTKLSIFFFLSLIFFIAIFISLYLTKIISTEYLKPVFLAYLLTTLNALIGLFSIKMAINKSEKTFIKWILGAIIIRMFATLLIVVLILIFLEINRISFIFSILFFYVYYLISEIIFLIFRSNY